MFSRLFLLALIVGFSATPVLAQEARDFSAASARVSRGPGGAPVTGPSQSPRPAIVSQFLAARHDARTVQTVVLRRENVAPTGVTHLNFGQQIADLDVYGTYVRAALSPRGEILSVVENLAAAPPALTPVNISARSALDAVLSEYYPGTGVAPDEIRTTGQTAVFPRNGRFSEEPTVTRVAVPMENGAMHTGYLVVTWDNDNVLRHTVVGPGGRILVEELRTNSDRYMVFANHPGVSPQTVVAGPGAGNVQSPVGWVASNTTTGNNVDAYLDRDNNNAADSGGRPISSTKDFVYDFSASTQPTTTTNQMVGVTNLFYLNNVIHDKLYRHGFNEAAGNFQTNNFGNGGAGSDAVRAEAQDGGGTNNANFATPADGSAPRMQMYLWNTTSPSRDGDLDSDIVWHEYGHGLTWRMIGSMSGPFAGAIGEGMSDTLAIYINGDDKVGEYSTNNSTRGIRRYAYTNYPLTYGAVTGSSVHNDGEIYAATMWKLRELWLAGGGTEDDLYDVVIDGMNYTPARPTYEAMRDGILAAAKSQAEDCVIWEAFALLGIGEGAKGTESCRGFTCRASVVESFVVPAVCSGGGGNTAPVVSISSPAEGTSVAFGWSITFTGSASDAEDGDLSSSLTWTSSLDGHLGTGGSFSLSTLTVGTHTITASAGDGDLTGFATVTITVTDPTGGGDPTISLEAAGRKVKGVIYVDLTWSGATSTNVDIFRNGEKIKTTSNNGAYTDNTGMKGGASLTYKVCEVGSTTVCSAERVIVF